MCNNVVGSSVYDALADTRKELAEQDSNKDHSLLGAVKVLYAQLEELISVSNRSVAAAEERGLTIEKLRAEALEADDRFGAALLEMAASHSNEVKALEDKLEFAIEVDYMLVRTIRELKRAAKAGNKKTTSARKSKKVPKKVAKKAAKKRTKWR